MNKNFAGYCHYNHKDTVGKLAQTLVYFLSYSDLNFRKNRVFLSKTATSTTNNNKTTNNKTIEDNFLGKTRQLQNSVVHVYNKIQPISTTGLEDNPLK